MGEITTTELRRLAELEHPNCASVFMPTFPFTNRGTEDAIRLKKLSAELASRLMDRSLRRGDAQDFVEPLLKLPTSANWARRQAGVAAFLAPGLFALFDLDQTVEEAVVIATRFYLRPLLPMVGPAIDFYLLAISRNKCRLLRCSHDSFTSIELPHVAGGMQTALNLQGADRGEQVHSAMRGDLGKEAAVFHGQGGHRDTIGQEITEYCRLVEHELRSQLADSSLPVILAGVTHETEILRRLSSQVVVAESLAGCFDHASDSDLFRQALPIAKRHFELVRRQPIDRFRTLLDRSLVVENSGEVLAAAREGRIDTLLIQDGASRMQARGHLPDLSTITHGVELMSDLEEIAIEQTLLHGGSVCTASADDLGSKNRLCAILRHR